jgi:hypothetical protein
VSWLKEEETVSWLKEEERVSWLTEEETVPWLKRKKLCSGERGRDSVLAEKKETVLWR